MARSVETAQQWPSWKRVLTCDHFSEWAEWRWDWENFTPEELSCRCCGKLIINEIAMDKLQMARRIFQRPMIINSATRCEKHNRAVGGATESYHLKGRAFDIDTSSMTYGMKLHLVQSAALAGLKGVGGYDSFIHIDTGPMRFWSMVNMLADEELAD